MEWAKSLLPLRIPMRIYVQQVPLYVCDKWTVLDYKVCAGWPVWHTQGLDVVRTLHVSWYKSIYFLLFRVRMVHRYLFCASSFCKGFFLPPANRSRISTTTSCLLCKCLSDLAPHACFCTRLWCVVLAHKSHRLLCCSSDYVIPRSHWTGDLVALGTMFRQRLACIKDYVVPAAEFSQRLRPITVWVAWRLRPAIHYSAMVTALHQKL